MHLQDEQRWNFLEVANITRHKTGDLRKWRVVIYGYSRYI